jgi:CHAD domain-containing protein
VPGSPRSQDDDPAQALLHERVKTVFLHLRGALAGKRESLHQVRVAGRRLRVALPLVARKPGGGRVRRAVRELRCLVRAAGQGRDLDVILPLFEGRVSQVENPPRELKTLLGRLRTARARSRSHLAEGVLDLDLAGLRAGLRQIVSRGADRPASVASRLRAWRDEQAAAIESQLSELGDRFEPAALHRIRRSTRRLRYGAEIYAALVTPSDAVERLRELQDLLGRIQDAHVLSAWLGALAARAERRGSTPALAAETRRQEAWFLELSQRHHSELLRRRPVDLLRRAVEVMGPVIDRPQGPATGSSGRATPGTTNPPPGVPSRGLRSTPFLPPGGGPAS